MNPANIISGFRSCGIFPFNPTAVLDHDPCACQSNLSSGSISKSVITADILQPNDDGNTDDAVCESFTAETRFIMSIDTLKGMIYMTLNTFLGSKSNTPMKIVKDLNP